MKYYELRGNERYKFMPRLINWFDEFDVRNISIGRFHRLPKRHLIKIKGSEKIIFYDIIFSPFLLVSHAVKGVIQMYGDPAYFREIILLNPQNGNSELYYLPVFAETVDLLIGYKIYDKGSCKIEPNRDMERTMILDRNIFWIHDGRKRHIIISQDLAESLLMRDVTGIDLQEIVLFKKDEKENQ